MKHLHLFIAFFAIGILSIAVNALYSVTVTNKSPELSTLAYASQEIIDTLPRATLLNTNNELATSTAHVLRSTEADVRTDKATAQRATSASVSTTTSKVPKSTELTSVFSVPFYSQFTDITPEAWKKVGCGIASLAMIIDYHKSSPPSVDTLLQEGIDANAYLNDAGWTYAGLIGVAKKYGLTGESHDLSSATMESAFSALQKALIAGPVIVSVHYKFEPTNPIPHLVVANGVHDGMFYYNDPAAKSGNLSIPISTFKEAWKKRYIELRPII